MDDPRAMTGGTEPPAPKAAMWSVSHPVSESIAPLTTRANSPKVMT